jgi:hypothetical protein
MSRGRPELYPIKKVIGFDQEMLDAIEEWRRHQTPIPNVSDAIRALVQLGLAAKPSTSPAEAVYARKSVPGTKRVANPRKRARGPS